MIDNIMSFPIVIFCAYKFGLIKIQGHNKCHTLHWKVVDLIVRYQCYGGVLDFTTWQNPAKAGPLKTRNECLNGSKIHLHQSGL